MIIDIDGGASVDTADLSPEERHVIQKLLAWHTLVTSQDQFREKKQQALEAGWNDSGPIRETAVLSRVIRQLDISLRRRLNTTGGC